MVSSRTNPKYPIYIVSKGRWEDHLRLTSKALERMGVPYHIVVEPQEYDNYASVIDPSKVLTLPFDNPGCSIPARNFAWEHAIKHGHERHWCIDDNIRYFARVNRNQKTRVANGICFKLTEDFVDRYENVAQAGLQYETFMPASCYKRGQHPFILNTRIYSCILLRNDLPFRWRGWINEDTDLSIRILKAGWCTVLVQAFVCKKMATMKMKGGNMDVLYKDGDKSRLEGTRSLYQQHPDVVRLVRKFGRWHHHVNYRPFRRNRLRLKPGVEVPKGVDEHGMVLQEKQVWDRPQKRRVRGKVV